MEETQRAVWIERTPGSQGSKLIGMLPFDDKRVYCHSEAPIQACSVQGWVAVTFLVRWGGRCVFYFLGVCGWNGGRLGGMAC